MNVLDHGHLILVDHMGSDKTVVNAARSSFAKADWMTKKLMEKDPKLIHFLAREKHVSPFYHPQVQFVCKSPISVQRQAFKHKIGTAENSESTRYTEVLQEFYVPEFRPQSASNRQGSDGTFDGEENSWLQCERGKFNDEAWRQYQWEIKRGVARELARDVLPLATYTSWTWTLSLMAAVHFIRLRTESHAQWEIQRYGLAMRELVTPLFPVSMQALLG